MYTDALLRTFGGFKEGSLIHTANTGKRFRRVDAAWDAANKDIQGLARKFYPEYTNITIAELGRMIPEAGVEIFEGTSNTSKKYYFKGIIVGSKDGEDGAIRWTPPAQSTLDTSCTV